MAKKAIPIIDFDELVDAIEALSAPSATNVSVDATGMDVITATNAQGALKQLDTAVDSVSSNLTKCQQVQFQLSTAVSIPSNSNVAVLDHFDISTSNLVDAVFTGKRLSELFGGHTILGVWGLWATGGMIPQESIVWNGTNQINVAYRNLNSSTVSVNAVRVLVIYR